MNFIFLIKEGISNLNRARLAAIISIISITLSLVLIGIFILIGENLKDLFRKSYQQIEMEAFLDPSLSEGEINRIQNTLLAKSQIHDIRYISSEEALEIYQQSFGEDLSSVLTENPLPPSFRIVLNPSFSNPDSIEIFTNQLLEISGLQEIWYHKEIVRLLHNYFKFALLLAGIVAIILIITTTIFVFNTIRLTIHARRNIIEIMRLVGATNFFIKSPFVIEGMIQGIMGGIIAAIILKILSKIIEYLFSAQVLMSQPLWTILIFLGIIFGLIGSYISVNKYL
jgi:cell division transport system permease protein